MKIAGMIMAATAALSIIGSSALAQQMRTGMVTRIDRISGTISIKDVPDGTVGANTNPATEEFKMQDGARLNELHAGDRVTFAVSESAGTKTITKIDRKPRSIPVQANEPKRTMSNQSGASSREPRWTKSVSR